MSNDDFGGVPGHVWVAQQRVINDADYRKTICDWLTANGIKPNDVPVYGRASIADGQLTIPLYVVNEKGIHVIDPNQPNTALTHTVTVPVKVKPNSDVELWLTPRCATCGR